jgi:uncharacterized protein YbaP (TraB family)
MRNSEDQDILDAVVAVDALHVPGLSATSNMLRKDRFNSSQPS